MRVVWPLLLLASCSGQTAIAPDGIVSNNPCIDGILAEVAAANQIAAISVYSHDANSASAPLGWAMRLPSIGTTAEEILAAKPRLLLTGNLASQGTNAALAKAGIPIIGMGVPATISESIAQVETVSRAIGRASKGAELAQSIEKATEQQRAKGSAIIWQSGGFVPGKGTLQDELLSRAGYQNAGERFGLGQWGQLPLETLMSNPPDVIFTSKPHPAFARLTKTRIAPFADRLSFCGGPTIIEAMAVLRS